MILIRRCAPKSQFKPETHPVQAGGHNRIDTPQNAGACNGTRKICSQETVGVVYGPKHRIMNWAAFLEIKYASSTFCPASENGRERNFTGRTSQIRERDTIARR